MNVSKRLDLLIFELERNGTTPQRIYLGNEAYTLLRASDSFWLNEPERTKYYGIPILIVSNDDLHIKVY